jgi:hypothetical protein
LEDVLTAHELFCLNVELGSKVAAIAPLAWKMSRKSNEMRVRISRFINVNFRSISSEDELTKVFVERNSFKSPGTTKLYGSQILIDASKAFPVSENDFKVTHIDDWNAYIRSSNYPHHICFLKTSMYQEPKFKKEVQIEALETIMTQAEGKMAYDPQSTLAKRLSSAVSIIAMMTTIFWCYNMGGPGSEPYSVSIGMANLSEFDKISALEFFSHPSKPVLAMAA